MQGTDISFGMSSFMNELFLRAFEGQQKEQHVAILEKILMEEDRMRRRKIQQPLLWEDPNKEKSKVLLFLI